MVGMHVCSGKIENIALFSKAEGCEKERNLPPCHRHEKAPCCDDEAIVHEGEDFNASYSEVSVPSISFVAHCFLLLSFFQRLFLLITYRR
jgi:hypothetical protein